MVVFGEDALAHTYTYLRMLAMRTYLAWKHVFVCLSVCLDVTAYPCVLKRVWTQPKNPTVCVCFPSSFCAFVLMSLNLYAHLCVYTSIYTSAGVHWCSFPSVFLAEPLQRAGYWCAACPHVPLHHPCLFTVTPHVCHVCEPLPKLSTNGVIRNKCSKVQPLDPTTP